MEDEFQIGIVKWFNLERGFGVISTIDKNETFLHIRAFKQDLILLGGEPVVFKKKFDAKKERNSASFCRLANFPDDIQFVWTLIGLNDKVFFEKSNPNQPGKKISYSVNLTKLVTLFILRNLGVTDFLNLIKSTFKKSRAKIDFHLYCDLIEETLKVELKEASEQALNDLYIFFGHNPDEEILFSCWKDYLFYRLNLSEEQDHEIQKDILVKNFEKLDFADFERICKYSYFQDIKKEYAKFKLSTIYLEEVAKYPSLVKLFNKFFPEWLLEMEKEMENGVLRSIETNFKSIINYEYSSNQEKLKQLKNTIEKESNSTHNISKEKLNEKLSLILLKSGELSLQVEAWYEDYLPKPNFELLKKYFFESRQSIRLLIKLLKNLDIKTQIDLFLLDASSTGIKNAYALFRDYIRSLNPNLNHYDVVNNLFNDAFWNGIEQKEILLSLNQFVEEEANPELKVSLYFDKLYPTITEDFINLNRDKIEVDQWLIIFDSFKENPDKIKRWFFDASELHKEEIRRFLEKVKDLISSEISLEIDLLLKEKLEKEEYFNLWFSGYVKITPEKEVLSSLNSNWESFQKYIDAINLDRIAKSDLVKIFFIALNTKDKVVDLDDFLILKHSVKAMVELGEENIKVIEDLDNSLLNLFLWHMGFSDLLDFRTLQKKYIYFNPDEQVILLKKLFGDKSKGKIDFSTEDLLGLTRFDLDLFKLQLQHNKEIPVDISTDLIIQVLNSFSTKGKALVESELLSIVLKDISFNKTKKFKIDHYFEGCDGRLVGEYNWKTEGKISMIQLGASQSYFKIEFSKFISEGERYQKWNQNFTNLVESVKKLPGRKWDPELGHWTVPLRYQAQVLEFAAQERFFLDFEGSTYINNPHLVQFKREAQPFGVSYCEGRPANKDDSYFKKKFWWCAGEKCFGLCETKHYSDAWLNYTLLDFLNILGINVDETNRMGDFLPNGKYYRFIGTVNRFNRLMERLYCRDCDEILYPTDISHFAAYNIVRFKCQNDKCCNKNEIYLNHCLNGKCNCIIDSRDSKKCEHGLYICSNCGSCCSHTQMQRRVSNLTETGGYIHLDLKNAVKYKLGHLERGEYFCHKCGSPTDENETNIFSCKSCKVIYDTRKYNFTREHKNLKKMED